MVFQSLYGMMKLLKEIIGEWGCLLSSYKQTVLNSTFQNPKNCVLTRKVLEIDETIKVVINGLGHLVKITKQECIFDPDISVNMQNELDIMNDLQTHTHSTDPQNSKRNY